MGGLGSGPRPLGYSLGTYQERCRRILAKGARASANTLVAKARDGDREAAMAVLAWVIGRPVQSIEGTITTRVLQLTPADLIAAVRELTSPVAIAQAVEEPAIDVSAEE